MSTGSGVLIVRTGAMGDVLHALPAVAALRQRWPDAAIDWVVDPRWAPLLVDAAGKGPLVSRLHLAPTRQWSRAPLSRATARSLLGLRRSFRAEEYPHVVDVQGTLRSAIIGRMAGSKSFAGFSDPRESASRLFYRQTFARRGVHVVEQNAAMLGDAVGVELAPAVAQLPVRAEAEDWAEQFLDGLGVQRPTALLAPGAGWGAKQWPAVQFGALARELQAAGFEVLVNAVGIADETALEVVRASGGAAHPAYADVAGLVALTRHAAVVVGGDSGPVHLAAALGRPVVALYGPTDPARNGPWGPGPIRVMRDPASATTYKRTAGVDAGLGRIAVRAVLEAVYAVAG